MPLKSLQRRRYRPRLEALESRVLPAAYFVSPAGNDANPGTIDLPFATIQRGLNVATAAGDSISVRTGTYHEKLEFPASGSQAGGSITLTAFPGEHPLLSGAGVAGENMMLLENISYVKIIGFEIADNTGVSDGSGIRVLGQGSHIEIRDNRIHDMLGESAMGITVYGTADTPISDLVIQGNEIYDSEPAPSEALTLNGNVNGFQIIGNLVHDVNNIGIDMIGGEKEIHPTQVARNGLVRGNTVYHGFSSYGGGYAAGIYVDGGKDIVIENNVSFQNDVGLEVGAENRDVVVTNVIVRNNLVYDNEKTGLGFGGYAKNRGRVQSSKFQNNVFYRNGTLNEGHSEIVVSYASNNSLTNNIIWGGPSNILLYAYGNSTDNRLDYNLWYSTAGPNNVSLTWNDETYGSFAAYKAQSGQDAHSLFADPKFLDALARDFHLRGGSRAIDTGSGAAGDYAPLDFDGIARPRGPRPDKGAFEFVAKPFPVPPIIMAGSQAAQRTKSAAAATPVRRELVGLSTGLEGASGGWRPRSAARFRN